MFVIDRRKQILRKRLAEIKLIHFIPLQPFLRFDTG
jgi:hypothetical protein